MIKLSFLKQGILSGLFLVLILFGVASIAYLVGIRSLLFYGLLLFSIFPLCVFFIISLKSEKQLKFKLAKVSKESRQLQEYITASWNSNQIMIHEEKILAIRFMMMGISHEINTPLGNALTSTSIIESLLAKNKINIDDINTALDLSQNNIRRTIDLIGKFKDMAQISLNEEQKNFSLTKLLDKISNVKKLEWSNKSIKLDIKCSDELTLNSYPHSLSVVLGVFLDNACESFPGDKGRIGLYCKRDDRDLSLILEDSGSGIKTETMEHIFDPFFTTTRGEKHMGLGLSMAENIIINLFEGDIKIESEWGVGTTIKIILPGALSHAKINLKRKD